MDGFTGWANISGATGSTYTPSTSTSGILFYRVIVTDTNTFCANPTSAATSVTVYDDATVDISADNAEVCLNDLVTLQTDVTGGSGAFTYQWEESADGSTGWTAISGETNSTFIAPTTTEGLTYYRVVVTDANTFCANPTSASLFVQVFTDATASISVDNAEVCLDGAVLLSTTVTGGSGSFTYQWQQSPCK